jgi:hypothetical protein
MPKSINGDEPVVDPLKAAPKLNSGETAAQDDVAFTDKPARARRKPAAPKVAPPPPPASPVVESLIQPVCMNGHAVTSAMKFCPQCGEHIPDPAAPPTCGNGHEVSRADKFCASCGMSLSPGWSAVAPAVELERPRPEGELTDQERAERMRAHAAAVRFGQESPPVAYAGGSSQPGAVVIHFLIDGFTALGNVWMRGQEIELWPGHPRWEEAQPWLTLDVAGQYERFNRQVFGMGPWPGAKTYVAGVGQFQPLKQIDGEGAVAQPTEEELAKADAAERRRGRRVPAPLR